MNTTIQIRVDNKIKKSAQMTLESMGLDLTSGIKMFLSQVITEQGIPFTPSKKRLAIRAKWDKEVQEALKGKGYNNAKEMHQDILGKKLYASLSK